jgi:hypothetical protein
MTSPPLLRAMLLRPMARDVPVYGARVLPY